MGNYYIRSHYYDFSYYNSFCLVGGATDTFSNDSKWFGYAWISTTENFAKFLSICFTKFSSPKKRRRFHSKSHCRNW